MNDHSRVADVIAGWQRSLLQLDRRNNLLYFKPGRRAVQLLGISPDDIEARLQSSRRGLSFEYAERVRRSRNSSLAETADDAGDRNEVRVTPGDITTDVEVSELQRRLSALHRREREWEEEQGLNVLFLTAGFLDWVDEDGEAARSPLVLLPCDLQRASPHDPFYLKREDDDAEVNATLAHKLREFGLELPELGEEPLSQYLDSVRRAVRGRDEWKVADDIVLSTFAYSKLAMYQDLERLRTAGVDHPLVRRLAGAEPAGAGPDGGGPTEPRALPPDRELVGGGLDDLLELRDQFTVVDADFSQLRVIEAARRGSHLVVHGPPGTGKSQTIANLIATLLAEGKRVLFVSEKTAALDVVKRRLEDCGLGVFCLDLHSERAKKSSVYEQLRVSLRDPRHAREPALSFEALQDRRTQLNAVARALHAVREPLGETVFKVHGRYAQVQDLPRVDFAVSDAATLDQPRLARIGAIARRIEVRTGEFGQHETSQWLPLKVEQVSVQLPDQLRDGMRRVSEAVDQVTARMAPLAEWAGSALPATAAECGQLAEWLDHAAAGEGVPPHWLDPGVLMRLRQIAAGQAEQQAQGRALGVTVAASFGESRPDTDYRQIASKLRLTPADRESLRALLGDTWERRVMPDPALSIEQLDALQQAIRDMTRLSSELSAVLGALEMATPKDLSDAVALSLRLLRLFPVPPPWLDPSEIDALRREIAAARGRLEALRDAERSLEADFAAELVDLVDQEMLVRYRTDYQSFWRRLGRSYRRDQRLVRGALKTPRRLPLAESLSGIERALAVQAFREEWSGLAAGLRARLGDRFSDRETDWDQVTGDLEETAALSAAWKAARETLHGLLTDPQLHEGLRSALTAAVDSSARLESALEAIGRESLREGDVALTELEDCTRRARGPLKLLVDATRDLVGRFRAAPADLQALTSLVDHVVRLEEIEREHADMASKLAADFGDRFTGADTEWSSMLEAVDWAKTLLDLAPGRLTPRATEHATAPVGSHEYRGRAEQLRSASQEFLGSLRTIDEDFDAARTPWGAWERARLQDLRQWAEDLARDATSAASWVEYRSAVRDLERELGDGVVDGIRAVTDDAASVPGIVNRRIYAAWLDHVCEDEPALRDFTAKDHEDIRREFQSLDRELIEAAKDRVRRRCFERYPDQYTTHTGAGELGVLNGELSKRRRQMPVRKLLRRVPQLLQKLKPCFLMSPLAVSQYLPRGELATESMEFDVVIFDEASQVFPEDAVPAIARAAHAVVAGDRQQLPPTNFFRHTANDDDDAVDDEDDAAADSFEGRESILDVMVGMAGRGVAEQYLTVHYRSRHESLIRYSNHYFYDDRLLTFPASGRDTGELGIRDVYVPDGRFDAGASRTNRREAEVVVDTVLQIMRSRPESESIGVVALSRAQADLIESLIEERRILERDLDERFAEDRHERFFVKNLERVQGDERDHIILSIGYGPTVASGAVPNRFGPINAPGGQRRLNVAVSRARRSMTVVHSLRAQDITAQSEGARLLRRYLEYVRDPVGAFESQVTTDPAAEPESPFEDEVRRALERRGYRVDSQVGVSGYRIDLAIRSEDGSGYDLGVECDGATYHSAPAARDRDRQRQEVLEGLGWHIHRVWSTSWVRNREAEIASIEQALELARAAPADPPDQRRHAGEDPGGSSAGVPSSGPAAPPTGGASTLLTSAQSEPTNFFEEYEEASLADIQVGSELQHEVERAMTALVRRVVEVEEPVHIDVVVDRIRDRYMQRRAGRLIRERIERGVEQAIKAGAVVREGRGHQGAFLRTPDEDAARPRRPMSGTSARRIEHISNSELQAGLLLVVKRMFSTERSDLIVETARQFGYSRTGGTIGKRLGQAVDKLRQQGLLLLHGDRLVASDPE